MINYQEEPYNSLLGSDDRDPITGLFTKTSMEVLAQYFVSENIPFTYMVSNLDNFRYINEAFGHPTGDIILRRIGESLLSAVGDRSIIGRYGGDSYFLLIPEVTDYDKVWEIAHTVSETVGTFASPDIDNYRLSITTGITRFPIDGTTLPTLADKTDVALYRGKSKGRNCYIIYLEDKHGSIKVDGRPAAVYSMTEVCMRVHDILSSGEDTAENILFLLKYLSSALMLDHIALQDDSRMTFSVIHPLSFGKSFKALPLEHAHEHINMVGLTQIDSRGDLSEAKSFDMLGDLIEQGITGIAMARVQAYGKHYGYLRADSTSINGRKWQDNDMAVLTVTARVIGMLLYHENKTLDSLWKELHREA